MIDVCRRVDGLPLAIELAAARLRSMTLPQLAARLDDRFRLLTGGSRTAMARQRTLRAVVDWSWDLLDEPERALLRRLAVFSGGATLDAVEAVCVGGPVAAVDVFDLLCALVDKSLLQIADAERSAVPACSRRSANTGSSGWPRRASCRRTRMAHAGSLRRAGDRGGATPARPRAADVAGSAARRARQRAGGAPLPG